MGHHCFGCAVLEQAGLCSLWRLDLVGKRRQAGKEGGGVRLQLVLLLVLVLALLVLTLALLVLLVLVRLPLVALLVLLLPLMHPQMGRKAYHVDWLVEMR